MAGGTGAGVGRMKGVESVGTQHDHDSKLSPEAAAGTGGEAGTDSERGAEDAAVGASLADPGYRLKCCCQTMIGRETLRYLLPQWPSETAFCRNTKRQINLRKIDWET